MDVRRTGNISKASSSGSVKGSSLSPDSVLMSFIFGMFRKKDRDRNQDEKERKFSREEQIMSGIIASDELFVELSKGIEPKNGNGKG